VSIPAALHVVGGRRTAAKDRPATALVMKLNRWDQRHDGPLTETALQQKLKALGYDPRPRATPPDVIVSARLHRRGRADAVLAGLLKVTLDGESVVLTAGDIVFVRGGTARRIEPVGHAPVRCIEAVSRSD
jgi:mannose-6-phosphate isomerase-like protein (cupin superfamily)